MCSMEPSATWMRAASARQPWHQACRQSSRTKVVPRCSSRHTPQVCMPSAKVRCSSTALYLRRGQVSAKGAGIAGQISQTLRQQAAAAEWHPNKKLQKVYARRLPLLCSPQQLQETVLGALLVSRCIALAICCAAAAGRLPCLLVAGQPCQQQHF